MQYILFRVNLPYVNPFENSKLKQNSQRSTHPSQRPNTSIVAVCEMAARPPGEPRILGNSGDQEFNIFSQPTTPPSLYIYIYSYLQVSVFIVLVRYCLFYMSLATVV